MAWWSFPDACLLLGAVTAGRAQRAARRHADLAAVGIVGLEETPADSVINPDARGPLQTVLLRGFFRRQTGGVDDRSANAGGEPTFRISMPASVSPGGPPVMRASAPDGGETCKIGGAPEVVSAEEQ